MTSPTPKVLTEADLAGLPRAVSSELPEEINAAINTFGNVCMFSPSSVAVHSSAPLREAIRNYAAALVSERDALAGRVAELEAALREAHEAIVLSKADFQQFFKQANAGNLKVAGISIMDAEMRLTASVMKGRAALSATTPESKP